MSSLTIDLDAMAFGGAAVGRLPSGKVAFVTGAAPGETVRARLVQEHRSRIEAEVVEILKPSPTRVEPACATAKAGCGGCPWMHLDVAEQRSWKRQLLGRELARAGLVAEAEQVPAPLEGEPFGYRTRTRLHRRGASFGTMKRHSSEVLPLSACPILAVELESFALESAELLATLPAADADLELYVDVDGHRGMHVEGLGQPSDLRHFASLAVELGLVAYHSVARGPRVKGAPGARLHEDSDGQRLAFEPGVFVQANRQMNARLVREAMQRAGKGARFVEIYAGAGNFTVHLAERFERGEACEADHRAAQLLGHNLKGRSGRVDVRREPDFRTAERLVSAGPFDLMLVDPPRAGMRPLAPLFEEVTPPRVVMISCHPMAAVRDMKTLATAGYRLVDVQPVDLFPQTDHLELVALLER